MSRILRKNRPYYQGGYPKGEMSFFRRILLALAFAAFLLFFPLASLQARENQRDPRVNVLFIAVDDLKPLLGCYGDEQVISPNIDQLAGTGTIFTNNHCQQAVCAPSRASLLTGLRPDKTRVWDLKTQMRDMNPDILTLPQYFKENGYETAGVGKIFDPRSVDKDLDRVSWSIPYVKVHGDRWMGYPEKVSNLSVDAPDEEFVDGKIRVAGEQLLERLASGEKPFFLAVGFKKPHLPFVAPKKYWDLYDRSDFSPHPFQQHAKYAPEFAFQPGWELRNGYVDVPKEGPIPVEKQLELIHGYYAATSFIDAQVGHLLARLDSLGLREKTVVILWGDHGWHLGDHAMWCKHTNFEQATRAPLIISAPNIAGDKKSDSPTEFVDIFPTLCELTGLPVPSHLDGVSLVPVMDDPATLVKKFAVSQYHRRANGQKVEGYALRTKRYRYVEWVAGFHTFDPYNPSKVVARELYDYETDPLETISLVDSVDYRGVVDTLSTWLHQFFEQQLATSVGKSQGSLDVPKQFELHPNYPNPFNGETRIPYTLHENGVVQLSILNNLGQELKALVSRAQPPGSYLARWSGVNASNVEVASGIYYYQLTVGSEVMTRRMTLLR